MPARLRTQFCAILLALLALSGCISITRKVNKPKVSTAALKEATLEQLVQGINANAAQLQTLNATVDIDYSSGGRKKGKITKYKEISGSILLRKPSMLRMIGLVPVMRNRLFDMASIGNTWGLSIPGQQKFLTGTNQVARPSEHPLENLRPQHILDALLLREIDPQNEIAVLEGGMELVKDPKTRQDVEQPDYELIVIRKEGGGWYLSRKIIISRVDLLPYRQLIYNRQGEVESDAHYDNFTTYNGVQFPSVVEIQRPIEELGITLTITKMRMNEPLRDDQFVLAQPPGAKIINLDETKDDKKGEPRADGKPAQ